jgi:hypothetical protein
MNTGSIAQLQDPHCFQGKPAAEINRNHLLFFCPQTVLTYYLLSHNKKTIITRGHY